MSHNPNVKLMTVSHFSAENFGEFDDITNSVLPIFDSMPCRFTVTIYILITFQKAQSN